MVPIKHYERCLVTGEEQPAAWLTEGRQLSRTGLWVCTCTTLSELAHSAVELSSTHATVQPVVCLDQITSPSSIGCSAPLGMLLRLGFVDSGGGSAGWIPNGPPSEVVLVAMGVRLMPACGSWG